MILGIGTDIIEIERFRLSIHRFGDRFISKLFTANEIAYCRSQQDPSSCFAARFAAKEAFSKAIATGNTGIFRWKDIELIYLPNGEPALQFYNAIQEKLHAYKTSLTLSVSELSVLAFVTIQANSDSKSVTPKPISDRGSLLQYP